MWSRDLALACRRHPDLVAAYQAPDGRLALLLRQTLLPLVEERGHWLNDTRRVARAAVTSLRAAGQAQDVTVLQWRRLEEVAHILACWTCRYLGDPVRYAQLADIVTAFLDDRVSNGTPPGSRRPLGWRLDSETLALSPTLLRWYRDMVPCFLEAEPPVRRRLILRTHRWIVERVLAPMARGQHAGAEELGPRGRLAWILVRVVPRGDLDAWTPWIRLVLGDLQRALTWPAGRRTEAWARWLFAIPYSIPPTRRRHAGPVPGSVGRLDAGA